MTVTAPHSARASARSERRAPRLALAALSCATIALSSTTAHADAWVDAQAAVASYANLTRARAPEDRRSDQATTFDLSGGRFVALSGSDGLSLTLDGHAEVFRRYRGLDMWSAGVGASYRHKFGLGSNVPWALAGIAIVRDVYRDEVRDGLRTALTLEAGHRFDARFDVAAGLVLDRRYGKFDPHGEFPGYSARVFDLQGRSAYLRGGYALNDKLLLGGRFAVRRGEVVSTSRRTRAIYFASDAIADDPAFDDDNLYAYRLEGTSFSTTASASWALDDASSLNFVYTDNRTRAGYGLNYADRSLMLAFTYRYP